MTGVKGEAYRDHVFAYVEKEDTPRPLPFQLDLLRQGGFSQAEVLHKNVCFPACGDVKWDVADPTYSPEAANRGG